MGFKLRGVIRCGRCGKSRGVRHTCITSRTRKRRHKAQNPVTWECGTCHKPRGLRHTCVIQSDFKKRKRAADRKRATARRRQRRQLTAAKRKLRRQLAAADRRARAKASKPPPKRAPRPRGESHEPGTCGDRDCPRFGCKSYWQGMADCPGPHEGGG
jgi:hypothetical protein